MIREARADQRDHVVRDGIGREAPPRRNDCLLGQTPTVGGVIVPPAARRLVSVHQQGVLSPHFPVEVLHAPGSPAASPAGKSPPAGKKAPVITDLDRPAKPVPPTLDHSLDAPFARLCHHNALGLVARNRALDLAGETAGVSRVVKAHIVDPRTATAQIRCKMPHRREHQHDLLLMMRNVTALLDDLHHQHGITRGVEVGESGEVERKLIAQHEPKSCHRAIDGNR